MRSTLGLVALLCAMAIALLLAARQRLCLLPKVSRNRAQSWLYCGDGATSTRLLSSVSIKPIWFQVLPLSNDIEKAL